jgi:hypothetical protein
MSKGVIYIQGLQVVFLIIYLGSLSCFFNIYLGSLSCFFNIYQKSRHFLVVEFVINFIFIFLSNFGYFIGEMSRVIVAEYKSPFNQPLFFSLFYPILERK